MELYSTVQTCSREHILVLAWVSVGVPIPTALLGSVLQMYAAVGGRRKTLTKQLCERVDSADSPPKAS